MTTNAAPVSQADLKRVARAAEKVARDQEALKQAILMARASGETLADIGRSAGLTAQRVHQIVGKR